MTDINIAKTSGIDIAKIYRIENEQTKHGMWYRDDGTFDPFIERLTEGKSRDLPMQFDERYYKDGVSWYSGCGDINQIRGWFSDLDALELYKNGYRLFQFHSKQFQEEEFQTIFTREGILRKEEIPIETIWHIERAGRT